MDGLTEYEKGYREATHKVGRDLLMTALDLLDPNDIWRDKAALIAERMEAVAVLRRACEAHGDNDWPDDLCLGDVIEKHLLRHLEETPTP